MAFLQEGEGRADLRAEKHLIFQRGCWYYCHLGFLAFKAVFWHTERGEDWLRDLNSLRWLFQIVL